MSRSGLFSWTMLPALVASAGALAQGLPSTPPANAAPPERQAQPPADHDEEIVLQGYRLRKDLDTTVRYPTAISTRTIARRYDSSERQARCAVRSRLSDRSWLRRVVDGEVNSSRHVYAQDRLTRIYATCGDGAAALTRMGPDANSLEARDAMLGSVLSAAKTVDPFPLGYSIYDRGAYTIQVLKRFAPDLVLTKVQTQDPAIERRFDLREVPRNRFRLPVDREYFRVAVCMVRSEPTLAVRLAMSDGAARFGDVQAALIDRARPCVGGAKNVQVDPTQFRIYIADAVYRWAVAARNVASLIPDDPVGQGG